MAAVYQPTWEDGSKPIPRATFGSPSEGAPSISMLERIWPVVRLHMANETTTGETFLQSLGKMRHILESAVLREKSDSVTAMPKEAQNALSSMAVEYLPRLLSYMPHIKTNKQEMGTVVLDILCYLIAAEQGSLFSFLTSFSSSLLHLPCPEWPQACQEIVSRLCHFVLPTCLVHPTASPLPTMSMSSTLMIVLESCTTRHHLLTLDTLMYLKRDVCIDILSLIAYGTPSVGQSALKLLLHYWPLSSEFSRNVSLYGEWQTPECENPTCRHGNVQASTLCLDAWCVAQNKGIGNKAKLYMLLCHECHSRIHRSVTDSDVNHFILKIPQPLRDVKPNCEYQNTCSGKERQANRAEVTCYDDHCTALQGGQPVRMCRDCHSKQHAHIRDHTHIYQVGPPYPWMSDDPIGSSVMLEAVSKLLQSPPALHKTSAVPPTLGRSASHTVLDGLQKIHTLPYQLMVEGSQEGIWLLSHYCTPSHPVPANCRDWLIQLTALALEWLQAYQDILKQVEEEMPSSPTGDSTTTSPDVTEYLQYFSNHNDIARLVDPLLISWLSEVAKSNSDCLVEALQPSPRPCAQVGKLWEKDCDSILRYQRTLRSLHRLYQFFRSSHIPRAAFMTIYNSVMPEWLDLLVQLRTETGKMSILHIYYHRLLTHPHPEGLEMIDFVWMKFRARGVTGSEMQKALLWLQDLTRLKIALPYIHHIFESAVEQKGRKSSHTSKSKVSVTSSFDEGVEERRSSMERERKGSTGSMSGSESEPALLSESGVEESDAQAIASLNSSLTRSILMLDIWLSQMKLETHMLDYGSLKRLLVKMLQMSWGSKHSYTDHHDTTNSCLLCKATALWFSLATQLLEENEKREACLEEVDDVTAAGNSFSQVEGHDGRPSRSQHQRISMKSIKNKIRRLTHGESNTSDYSTSSLPMGSSKFGTYPGKKGDSRKAMSAGSDVKGKSHHGEEVTDFDREFPPAEVKSKLRKHQLRRTPVVQSELAQALPSLREEDEEEEEEGEEEEEEGEEEDTENIHTIFHLCRDHLKPKLHPEAIHKIVLCLTVLVRKAHVFHDMVEIQGQSAARSLFKDLWKCLAGQSSFAARSCVALMIDCLKFLNDQELPRGLDKSTGWTVFYEGLKTDKFRTVEKFCTFLQFMLSPETELDWNGDSSTVISIQVTVAHSFCLAVQLLQDKTSSVTSRAQYCLANLAVVTVKALRKFVIRLFLDHPTYRTLTLHSLSLLNSALPELRFLSTELLERIIYSLAPDSASSSLTHSTRLSGDHTGKKMPSLLSDVSVSAAHVSDVHEGGARSLKASVSSVLPSSPVAVSTSEEEGSDLLQMALAVLLKYLANPGSDAEESLKKVRLQRGLRETSLEPEVRPLILSRLTSLHQDPHSLRANPVFHVFLDHIYPVLDNNQEFCSANALTFVLNRLIHCTAPTGDEEFLQCLHPSGGREGKRCEFGLGVLPPALRAPWLRVFYIILYKYIHNYQSGVVDAHHDLMFLTRSCMEIALNSIEVSPHTCPLLPASSHTPLAPPPSLRRQRTAESYPGSQFSSPSPNHQAREGERGREARSLSSVLEDTALSPQHVANPIRLSSAHKLVHSTASNASADSVGSLTSVFLRPHSIPTLHSGLCSVCGRVTNEFAEDVITLCAIVVATCCHRLPTRVSGYLVSRVIPALAKIINTESGSYTWQRSSDDLPPGSASAVTSNLLKSLAMQFADRRLFLFLFNYQYTAAMATEVFASLGASLPPPSPQGEGEGEGPEEDAKEITVVSPVTYFLQDAINSHNFPQEVRLPSLVHLALYVEKTPLSLTSMFKTMNLVDTFCRKLKSTPLLHDARAVYAYLRFIIQLLVSAPDTLPQSQLRSPPVQSFSLSLSSCLETIFSSVYCPVAGLYQLAANWYKTFMASPRDAGRIVQLYISELRRALKSTPTPEAVHFGTLVSLVQVLLLEERGYLSYVDSLTEERVYAPQLRDSFEYGDIFLNTIQAMEWDFTDVMLFLDFTPSRLSAQNTQELPQLKLLLGQLVALRVQHGRPPIDHLRRLISGDFRLIAPSKGSNQRSVVRWYDQLSALHIFAWLLLGSMCHNAVHQVFSADDQAGLGGRCQLLGSLETNMDVITSSAIWLTRGAMQGMRRMSDTSGSQSQYLLFTFTAIWTFYMESWEPNCTSVIVQFWENFVSNMVDMLGDYNVTDEKHRVDVLHNVNDKIIIPLKKCGLACYTLLLPIWRKLSNQLTAGQFQVFPIIPANTTVVTMDTWFKEMVSELATVETESSPHHVATTAL